MHVQPKLARGLYCKPDNRAILVFASEETTRLAGQDGKGTFDFQTPDAALSAFGSNPPYLGSLRSHA